MSKPRQQRPQHPNQGTLKSYGIKHDPDFPARLNVMARFGYDARTIREVEETRSERNNKRVKFKH